MTHRSRGDEPPPTRPARPISLQAVTRTPHRVAAHGHRLEAHAESEATDAGGRVIGRIVSDQVEVLMALDLAGEP